jgi:hypothetical protein
LAVNNNEEQIEKKRTGTNGQYCQSGRPNIDCERMSAAVRWKGIKQNEVSLLAVLVKQGCLLSCSNANRPKIRGRCW